MFRAFSGERIGDVFDQQPGLCEAFMAGQGDSRFCLPDPVQVRICALNAVSMPANDAEANKNAVSASTGGEKDVRNPYVAIWLE